MAEVKWTEDQEKAIYTRNCNLLVAAAAGSGKTAVLVERIIKIITDINNPVDIDKLLVVTFTNAAASEMRERISEAISKEIHKEENSSRLQKQLTLLNKASITTIHSFCLKVIKNNFHEIDLDPGFRIAEDTETILLKNEAIEEIFEEKYILCSKEEVHNTAEDFLNLVECYCNNKDDSALMDMVLKIYRFSMSMPNPTQWLLSKAEEFNVGEDYSIENENWSKVLRKDLLIQLKGLNHVMTKALEIINMESELEPYRVNIEDELCMLMDCIKACENSFGTLVENLKEVDFKKLKTIRNCENKEAQKAVQDIRKTVKDDLKKIVDELSTASEEEVKKDKKFLYPIIKSLCNLVIEFGEKYKKKKRERGIIDFNDFEHYCLDILIEKDEDGKFLKDEKEKYLPSQVALQLRDKYEEILIDEYQDSNMVQEVMLNMVSRETQGNPNIFMVGDVKQSIYRFRQAKPELFLEKYNSYKEEQGEVYRKITLFKNFRSREEVIEGVNYIFHQIMSESIGELNYDEKEALNLGANYAKGEEVEGEVGGAVELHLIEKEEDEALEEAEEEGNEENNKLLEVESPSNIAIEARMVAKRIRELMEYKGEESFKVFDKCTKEYRNVKYRDIVILLRSTAEWAPVFMEELKSYDIPVYADTNTGYFESTEIQIIMSLLQIIDNPRQDIPLLAVMRSPIGGFTPEDFINIRFKNRYVKFYESCMEFMKEHGHPEEDISYRTIAENLEKFFNKLNKWREMSLHMPIDEFIWYLYTDTGFYGFAGAMSTGVQRQANLKILFQRARQYEKSSYKGLFNFVTFINKLKKSSGDMGSAKILGENEDVVRIMSIHKSKGLEFPVVFLSGCGKQFNLQDLNQNLLMHHELGFGPNIIDYKRRISYSTVLKQVVKKKILFESLSEEMRILYVALTRAKEKLIITGALKDIPKYLQKYKDVVDIKDYNIPEFYIMKGRRLLDWIVPCIMRHQQGKLLRDCADITRETFIGEENNSTWKIKIWNKEEFLKEEYVEQDNLDLGKEIREVLEKNVSENNSNEDEVKSYKNLVEHRLSYIYPYKEASKFPTVITVTEIKRRINAEMDMEDSRELLPIHLHKKPRFLEEIKGLSSAERGTAVHEVMQYLDLSKVNSLEEIKNQIQSMIMREFITEQQGKVVKEIKILNFFSSAIGKRLLKDINKVYREAPFHLQIDSSEVYKELANNEIYKDEKIMLQGIIDCYFEEEGDIILIDYKTDFIKEGQEDEIVKRYISQIQYYTRALEYITNKKVKERYLYLFSIDKEIRV